MVKPLFKNFEHFLLNSSNCLTNLHQLLQNFEILTFKNVFLIKSNFMNFFIKISDTFKHNIVNLLMEIRQIASQDNIINDYFE